MQKTFHYFFLVVLLLFSHSWTMQEDTHALQKFDTLLLVERTLYPIPNWQEDMSYQALKRKVFRGNEVSDAHVARLLSLANPQPGPYFLGYPPACADLTHLFGKRGDERLQAAWAEKGALLGHPYCQSVFASVLLNHEKYPELQHMNEEYRKLLVTRLIGDSKRTIVFPHFNRIDSADQTVNGCLRMGMQSFSTPKQWVTIADTAAHIRELHKKDGEQLFASSSYKETVRLLETCKDSKDARLLANAWESVITNLASSEREDVKKFVALLESHHSELCNKAQIWDEEIAHSLRKEEKEQLVYERKRFKKLFDQCPIERRTVRMYERMRLMADAGDGEACAHMCQAHLGGVPGVMRDVSAARNYCVQALGKGYYGSTNQKGEKKWISFIKAHAGDTELDRLIQSIATTKLVELWRTKKGLPDSCTNIFDLVIQQVRGRLDPELSYQLGMLLLEKSADVLGARELDHSGMNTYMGLLRTIGEQCTDFQDPSLFIAACFEAKHIGIACDGIKRLSQKAHTSHTESKQKIARICSQFIDRLEGLAVQQNSDARIAFCSLLKIDASLLNADQKKKCASYLAREMATNDPLLLLDIASIYHLLGHPIKAGLCWYRVWDLVHTDEGRCAIPLSAPERAELALVVEDNMFNYVKSLMVKGHQNPADAIQLYYQAFDMFKEDNAEYMFDLYSFAERSCGDDYEHPLRTKAHEYIVAEAAKGNQWAQYAMAFKYCTEAERVFKKGSRNEASRCLLQALSWCDKVRKEGFIIPAGGLAHVNILCKLAQLQEDANASLATRYYEKASERVVQDRKWMGAQDVHDIAQSIAVKDPQKAVLFLKKIVQEESLQLRASLAVARLGVKKMQAGQRLIVSSQPADKVRAVVRECEPWYAAHYELARLYYEHPELVNNRWQEIWRLFELAETSEVYEAPAHLHRICKGMRDVNDPHAPLELIEEQLKYAEVGMKLICQSPCGDLFKQAVATLHVQDAIESLMKVLAARHEVSSCSEDKRRLEGAVVYCNLIMGLYNFALARQSDDDAIQMACYHCSHESFAAAVEHDQAPYTAHIMLARLYVSELYHMSQLAHALRAKKTLRGQVGSWVTGRFDPMTAKQAEAQARMCADKMVHNIIAGVQKAHEAALSSLDDSMIRYVLSEVGRAALANSYLKEVLEKNEHYISRYVMGHVQLDELKTLFAQSRGPAELQSACQNVRGRLIWLLDQAPGAGLGATGEAFLLTLVHRYMELIGKIVISDGEKVKLLLGIEEAIQRLPRALSALTVAEPGE